MKKLKKILVTGHRGYIGKHLYNQLVRLGYSVDGVDLKEGVDVLYALPDKKQYDVVFHMAALPSVQGSIERPSYTLMHNVLGTSRVLEWAVQSGVRRVVFSSSAAIYGDAGRPISPYGLHKWMSEEECRVMSSLHDLDTVSLRYFNVYSKDQPYGGAYSTVVSAWMHQIQQSRPLRIDGDGTQERDFVHVEDVVAANIFCMDYQKRFNGEAYDIGTGFSTSLNDIKKIIDAHHCVSWDHSPGRSGDIRLSCANTIPLKDLGWAAKISSISGITECFI